MLLPSLADILINNFKGKKEDGFRALFKVIVFELSVAEENKLENINNSVWKLVRSVKLHKPAQTAVVFVDKKLERVKGPQVSNSNLTTELASISTPGIKSTV